jgi:hypothetical protein
VVAATLEHGLDYTFMLPGETAKQDGDFAAFVGAKRSLDGTTEVMDGPAVESHHAGQPSTLLRQLALNVFFRARLRQFVQRKIEVCNGHGKFPLSSELSCSC